MWRRYSHEKDAEPKPAIGRSANSFAPCLTSDTRPLVALFADAVSLKLRCRRPAAASATTIATASTSVAPTAVARGEKRAAAITTRPASSATMLDCDTEPSSPSQSSASMAAASATLRRLLSHIIAAARSTIASARKRP